MYNKNKNEKINILRNLIQPRHGGMSKCDEIITSILKLDTRCEMSVLFVAALPFGVNPQPTHRIRTSGPVWTLWWTGKPLTHDGKRRAIPRYSAHIASSTCKGSLSVQPTLNCYWIPMNTHQLRRAEVANIPTPWLVSWCAWKFTCSSLILTFSRIMLTNLKIWRL